MLIANELERFQPCDMTSLLFIFLRKKKRGIRKENNLLSVCGEFVPFKSHQSIKIDGSLHW